MSNDTALHKKRRAHPFCVSMGCIYIIIVTFYAPILFPSYDTQANNILFLLLSFFPRIFIWAYMWRELLREYYVLKKHSNIVFSLFLLIISLLLSYLSNMSGLEYTISLLFISTAFFYFNVFKLSHKDIKKVLLITSLLAICILCNTTTSKNFVIYGNIPGKFNPNTGAFLIAVLFMAFLSYYLYYKKAVFIIASVLCFALQVIYMSRIALFGMIIFTLLMIIFKARSKTFKYNTVFVILLLCSFLGILFPYIYVNLFNNIGYGKIIIYGKDLFSGREIIWSLAFQSIKNHLWLGVGNKLNMDYFLSHGSENVLLMNAHNQPLGILAAFGLIPFILFYLSFTRIVSMPYKREKTSRIPALYVVTIILMSYTDITFFADYNFIFLILVYAIISGMRYSNKTVGDRHVFNYIYANF